MHEHAHVVHRHAERLGRGGLAERLNRDQRECPGLARLKCGQRATECRGQFACGSVSGRGSVAAVCKQGGVSVFLSLAMAVSAPQTVVGFVDRNGAQRGGPTQHALFARQLNCCQKRLLEAISGVRIESDHRTRDPPHHGPVPVENGLPIGHAGPREFAGRRSVPRPAMLPSPRLCLPVVAHSQLLTAENGNSRGAAGNGSNPQLTSGWRLVGARRAARRKGARDPMSGERVPATLTRLRHVERDPRVRAARVLRRLVSRDKTRVGSIRSRD